MKKHRNRRRNKAERKRILAAVIAGLLVLLMIGGVIAQFAISVSAGTNTYAGDENITQGGIVIHNTTTDFKAGQCTDTIVIDKEGGVIELSPNASGLFPVRGIYVSPEIYTESFQYLVLSWNTDTPSGSQEAGTYVKIEVQVWERANAKRNNNDWLLIGTWSTSGDKASAQSLAQCSNDFAYVDIDTVVIKDGLTADAFRYRLTLITEDTAITPTVRLVSATLSRGAEQGIKKAPVEGDIAVTLEQIDAFTGVLDVRAYSQYTRDPQFASIICSPVCAAMVLDYKGVRILPEMAAMGVLDTFYDGYGNWPFNAAFIGSFGYEAYMEYCVDFDDIKLELMQQNPVLCSVRYKQSESIDKNLPVITNAPISSTNGHIVVVVGYERDDDGKTWVVVNDPAAATDAEVRRRYEESQFLAAWSASGKVAIKIHKSSRTASTAPKIKDATLIPTGKTKTLGDTVYYEYALTDEAIGLISAAKAINPHNPRFETGISIVVWDDENNKVHSYATPGSGAGIWLHEEQLDRTVYIFLKTGNYYKARQL